MSRYIDADALKNDINAQVAILNAMSVSTGIDELRQIGEKLQQGMIAEIDKQLTIDAVPVVRCKECVYYLDEQGSCRRTDIIRSYMRIILPNWFCADGERK